MTDRRIIVTENGKQVPKQSASEQWDFQSVRIGASNLEISESAGLFDFNSKRIKIADGVASDEASSRGQLDTLQTQVDTIEAESASNAGSSDAVNDAFGLLFARPEEEALTSSGQTIFNFTSIIFSRDNTVIDLDIFEGDRWKRVDITGGLGKDFRKNSETQVEFAYTVPNGVVVTARKPNPFLSRLHFIQYKVSIIGDIISTAKPYTMGTDQLGVYKNGVCLVNSTTIGEADDRYQEATPMTVYPESASLLTDVWGFLHKNIAPIYKSIQDGLSTSVITVPSYTMSVDRLLVFRDGYLLNKSSYGVGNEYFSETSETSITLGAVAVASEYYIFEYLAEAPTWSEDITGVTGGTLTFSGSYTLGTDRLLLYKNGKLMYDSTTVGTAAERYQQNNPTSVTLGAAAIASDIFTAILLSN